MKGLVTGATGLAGQHLVELLLQSNAEVVALGRNQVLLNQLEEIGAETLVFDLTSDYDKFNVLNQFDEYVWFHVASAISGASQETLEATNIDGTKKLVAKAEEIQVPKFILVSSISTYGAEHDNHITEDDAQTPGSYYGYTKLIQEQIVKNSELVWSIIRPPYIGGPNDLNFLEEFGSRIENKKMPTFSKDGIISYVDARDLGQAMIELAKSENANYEAFNVRSGTISHSSLLDVIGRNLGESPPYGPHYSYPVAMIIGVLGEIWAKLRGRSSERGVSRYRIKTLCRQHKLNDQKLREIIGFQPSYSIEQSVKDWVETREA